MTTSAADSLPVRARPSGLSRVQRGVYAQAWYAGSHCYHPSLPPRRLKMAEHFADFRATMLTWPMLGGGGISLPYLEGEAYGSVPARYRFYGYVSDQDFVAACHERGIAVFSVIFCMQGWEFGAELTDDEDEILALNELRGVGKRTTLGLREFTQDAYPKLWKSFSSYFPEGLRNHRGEPVTDLWEEACSRGIDGRPLHAHWVECADRDQQCHYMDLNNPVWLEYLKAVIRIHVDAGVDGIQFDEPSSPISALQYGGCFCDVCMTGFARYLQDLPGEGMPDDVRAAVVADGPGFHYGSWLLARGKQGISADERDYLTDAYAQYTRRTAAESFAVLTGYAREYAASRGRRLLISANLYDGLPVFDPHVAMVDVPVPEYRTTLYKQPGWLRYLAGFAGDRPLVVNVNPYGGVLPELAEEIGRGRGHDRLRLMMYEAAAMGVNLSVPYGAWMGSITEDAFYAPHGLATQVQDFLADNEGQFGGESLSDVGVVYSVDSNFLEVSFRDMTVDDRDTSSHGRASGRQIGFFQVCDALAAARVPFDAVVFHDGVLREDDASATSLRRFRTVVLPDCTELTPRQWDAVRDYLATGGRVVVVGALGCADRGRDASEILVRPDVAQASPSEVPALVADRRLAIECDGDLAVNLLRNAGGNAVLHIVNYDYDPERDAAVSHQDVELTLDLPGRISGARLLRPGHPDVVLDAAGSRPARITLPSIDIYAVVEFLGSE